MQKHSRIIMSLAAALLVAATGAKAEDIIIAVPNPSYVPLLPIAVAMGEGYFEDEGLDPVSYTHLTLPTSDLV